MRYPFAQRIHLHIEAPEVNSSHTTPTSASRLALTGLNALQTTVSNITTVQWHWTILQTGLDPLENVGQRRKQGPEPARNLPSFGTTKLEALDACAGISYSKPRSIKTSVD
ncbi:hypothetical protein VTL71DRAFT_1244 [Oculimacula yallundae]|uniref:Uncharacterized protein n=1 Tax=Oculimacula yallundae TaxID=86028 RepID=A0ABR4CAK9_9HELO